MGRYLRVDGWTNGHSISVRNDADAIHLWKGDGHNHRYPEHGHCRVHPRYRKSLGANEHDGTLREAFDSLHLCLHLLLPKPQKLLENIRCYS